MLINCGHVDDPQTKCRIAQAIILQSALGELEDQEQREELLVQTILAVAEISTLGNREGI